MVRRDEATGGFSALNSCRAAAAAGCLGFSGQHKCAQAPKPDPAYSWRSGPEM